MKKRLTLLFVCVFAFLGVFFGLNLNTKAKASVTNPEITNSTRVNYDMDENLFRVIQALTRQINYNQAVYGFNTDLFTYGYNAYEPNPDWDFSNETHQKWRDNRNVIVEDLGRGELDLTVGENAKYACLKSSTLKPISSLRGLNCMSMETIKKLTINNANLTEVSDLDFETLPNLTSLSMKNCGLSSFKLNSVITKLNDLDLSNNNLTNIDLSKMVATSSANPSVNLTNNKIDNLQNVIFGQTEFSKINLNFNLLSDFSDSDYQSLSEKILDSNNLFVGIQSQNGFDNMVAGDKILVTNYQNNFVNELNVVASYYAGSINNLKSSFYVDGQDNTICDTSGEEQFEVMYAPAGKIFFEFFAGNNPINLVEYPEFQNKFIKIPLQAPTYILKTNGEVVTDYYQQSDINVIFSVVNNADIPNLHDVVSENGAKIYSGSALNLSKDPKAELVVNKNGTFELSAKVEFDGISSLVTTISVTRQNTTGIVWGVIIILFLVIIGAAVYYITRWIKDGAVVAPLNEKEIYSLKKREERKYNRQRQDSKKPLDASLRQAWREEREKQNGLFEEEQNKTDTSFYNYGQGSDYDREAYDENYRKFAHSSYDDGYLDEDLNGPSDIEGENQDTDEDEE